MKLGLCLVLTYCTGPCDLLVLHIKGYTYLLTYVLPGILSAITA